MKLASYVHAGRESFGLALDGGFFDLKQRLDGADIVSALAGPARDATRALAREARAEIPYADVRFLQPIPRPARSSASASTMRPVPASTMSGVPPIPAFSCARRSGNPPMARR